MDKQRRQLRAQGNGGQAMQGPPPLMEFDYKVWVIPLTAGDEAKTKKEDEINKYLNDSHEAGWILQGSPVQTVYEEKVVLTTILVMPKARKVLSRGPVSL